MPENPPFLRLPDFATFSHPFTRSSLCPFVFFHTPFRPRRGRHSPQPEVLDRPREVRYPQEKEKVGIILLKCLPPLEPPFFPSFFSVFLNCTNGSHFADPEKQTMQGANGKPIPCQTKCWEGKHTLEENEMQRSSSKLNGICRSKWKCLRPERGK